MVNSDDIEYRFKTSHKAGERRVRSPRQASFKKQRCKSTYTVSEPFFKEFSYKVPIKPNQIKTEQVLLLLSFEFEVSIVDGQSCNPLLTDGIFDEQFSLCAVSEHSATCEVRLDFLPLSALMIIWTGGQWRATYC